MIKENKGSEGLKIIPMKLGSSTYNDRTHQRSLGEVPLCSLEVELDRLGYWCLTGTSCHHSLCSPSHIRTKSEPSRQWQYRSLPVRYRTIISILLYLSPAPMNTHITGTTLHWIIIIFPPSVSVAQSNSLRVSLYSL